MTGLSRASAFGATAILAMGLSGCAQIERHCEEHLDGCIAIALGATIGAGILIAGDDDKGLLYAVTYREDEDGTKTPVDEAAPRGNELQKKEAEEE